MIRKSGNRFSEKIMLKQDHAQTRAEARRRAGGVMGVRWLLILLLAGLAGGGGYYFWQQQSAPKLDIQTVAATRGDVRRVVSTTGTVRALGTVEIGSQLSGNIREPHADFSSEVKQGEGG